MGKETNSYEEARRLRVQENLKHLECLGISKLSKSLSEVAKCENKLAKCHASPRLEKNLRTIEVRRSTRARNLISSYRDDMYQDDDMEHRVFCRRGGSSTKMYNGRIPSYEEQVCAIENAEKLRDDLKSDHPSFVKPMVRSHVSSCFWLGLPSKFCKEHLPSNELKMILEDEKGLEYDAIYIGSRTGLSGGWRGFALDHGLEDGDALLFELSEPDRFKIYIIKAIGSTQVKANMNNDATDTDTEGRTQPQKMTRSMEKKDLLYLEGTTQPQKVRTRSMEKKDQPAYETPLTRRSKRVAN